MEALEKYLLCQSSALGSKAVEVLEKLTWGWVFAGA